MGGIPVLSSISFSLRGKRIMIVMKPSKYKGDAFLQYVGHLRRVSANMLGLGNMDCRGRGGGVDGIERGVKVIFRDCSLFPGVAVLGGLLLTPVGMRGEGGRRIGGRTRRLLSEINLLSGGSGCPERLSNNRGRQITVMHTVLVRPRVVLLSRVATTLSPRVMERMLRMMLRLTGAKVAVLVIARRVRFTHSMTSEIVFVSGKGVMRRGAPRRFFSGPRASETGRFLGDFRCRAIGG